VLQLEKQGVEEGRSSSSVIDPLSNNRSRIITVEEFERGRGE
jgi:hypothetical protein